jgi:hypothetical protein
MSDWPVPTFADVLATRERMRSGARGLITGSTGNHGQSVALGARQIRPRRFTGLWTGWVPGSDSIPAGGEYRHG